MPATGADGPLFAIETSALVATLMVTLAVPLPGTGSDVVEATAAVLVSAVPFATPGARCTVSVRSAVAPSSISALVQTIGPLPVQAKPPLPEIETKVVDAGGVIVSATFWAAVGPLLSSCTTNCASVPAIAAPMPVVDTLRSADGLMYSYAPMSQCNDRGRETPRWSKLSQVAFSPAS